MSEVVSTYSTIQMGAGAFSTSLVSSPTILSLGTEFCPDRRRFPEESDPEVRRRRLPRVPTSHCPKLHHRLQVNHTVLTLYFLDTTIKERLGWCIVGTLKSFITLERVEVARYSTPI